MDLKKDIKDTIEVKKSFWISERIIFVASLVTFFLFALILMFTEGRNTLVHHKSFLDLFFDTVSVGTLTGLFRGDSGNFTFSGQLVLLLDMVVNGIITSFISILLILFVRLGFDRKKSLKSELEKMGLFTFDTLLFVVLDLLFIWVVGTLLFSFSGGKNLWESIFNSASHIFNDGVTALPNNMIIYNKNFHMLLSGAFLITIGGWGIGLRAYFYKFIFKLLGSKKMAQKIPESLLAPKNFLIFIILVTVILQLFGGISIFFIEHNNFNIYASHTSNLTQFINSYYMSVSARTAGFTTFPNLALFHDKSAFILMGLMSIGAASGSFAGGILKLTAFMYLFIYIISHIRGDLEVETPHKHLHFSQRTVIEANFRVIGFSIITFLIVLVLCFIQPNLSGLYLLFESISAVSNTGLTLGATDLLNNWGMILIIILMIVGKLGFITTVISFSPKYQRIIENSKSDFDELPVD